MTANGIAWANFKETERSNKARESETSRHDLVSEVETERHNRNWELEMNRHNIATETQALFDFREVKRHNMATEATANRSLNESIRHNKANEGISWYNAKSNAALGWANVGELKRHNKATEATTRRQVENQAYANTLREREIDVQKDKILKDWSRGRFDQMQDLYFKTVGTYRDKTDRDRLHQQKVRDFDDYIIGRQHNDILSKDTTSKVDDRNRRFAWDVGKSLIQGVGLAKGVANRFK